MRVAQLGQMMPTVQAILNAYGDANDEEERTYLGASVIGEPCERKLWYGFRWTCEPETFDGRMLRLFATGHREEARMVDDLRRSGVEVWDVNPEDGKQWGFFALGGHFRGHLDGVLLGVKEAPKTPHVGEFKTHNLKSFKSLLKYGCEISKPLHYAQQQIYMHELSLTRSLYLAHCKDTDELYAERITYHATYAMWQKTKAERIIFGHGIPNRLHDDVTARAAFACGWCPAKALCHENAWPRRNCRTCAYATPVDDGTDNGTWRCSQHKVDLAHADQKAGCVHHAYIEQLVPGEVVASDDHTITYRLRDGSQFIDGLTVAEVQP